MKVKSFIAICFFILLSSCQNSSVNSGNNEELDNSNITADSIAKDMLALMDAGRFEEVKQKYGNMLKDAIVDCSEREGWWDHDKLVAAEVYVYKYSIHIAHWRIDPGDLNVESSFEINGENQTLSTQLSFKDGKLMADQARVTKNLIYE